jgi:hypothetical protein
MGLQVPGKAKKRFLRLFHGHDGSEHNWERVKAIGITTWTQGRPKSAPVRAATDWSNATQNHLGAISGNIFLEDKKADGGVSTVTWAVAMDTSSGDTDGWRILPMKVRPTNLDEAEAESSFVDLLSFESLGDWDELNSALPSTPSELADDILTTAIDLAVDGGVEIGRGDEDRDAVVPHHDLPLSIDPALSQFLEKTAFLNSVVDQFETSVSKAPQFGKGSTEVTLIDRPQEELETEPAFNLWLSFDD